MKTNDAVRTLIARYRELQNSVVIEETKISNARARLDDTRKKLSEVGDALTALGADPTTPEAEEEF